MAEVPKFRFRQRSGILARAHWTAAEKEAQAAKWNDEEKTKWKAYWVEINKFQDIHGTLRPEDYAEIARSPQIIWRAMYLKKILVSRRKHLIYWNEPLAQYEKLFTVSDDAAKQIETDNYNNHTDLFDEPWTKKQLKAWAGNQRKPIPEEILDYAVPNGENQEPTSVRNATRSRITSSATRRMARSEATQTNEDEDEDEDGEYQPDEDDDAESETEVGTLPADPDEDYDLELEGGIEPAEDIDDRGRLNTLRSAHQAESAMQVQAVDLVDRSRKRPRHHETSSAEDRTDLYLAQAMADLAESRLLKTKTAWKA